MDDVSTKKDYLERKLNREVTNLARLRESLTKSSEQTGSMLKVLDKFQERLHKLEVTIQPVYVQTRSYQIRQENLDKTLTSIDKVIGYYSVATDMEEIITSGHVTKDARQYMNAMIKLKAAIDYFGQHHRGSPEYSAVNTLYQKGKKAIEREFQVLLTQYSKPLLPIQLANLIGLNEDAAEFDLHPMDKLEYMPESVREQLEEISSWLVRNLSTTDFMINYAQTRASRLTKSLQGLIDQQKSSSGDSIVSASPSTITNINRAKKAKGAKGLLKRALLKGTDTPAKREEELFMVETEGYMNCVTAFLKLIQLESELMNSIIPQKHQRKVFEIMIQPCLDLLVKEGEKLGESVLKAAEQYSFKEVPLLFPLVKHLRALKPEFDVKLEGCQPINRSKFAALINNLDNMGNTVLNRFIESIRNDPDKSSNMPVDGTVHELTRNTMSFMTTLKENAEVVGAMLLVLDPMYREQNVDHLIVKVADYMTKVLSALGRNLKNKSGTYHDPHLAAIFMLNNYNYIQQKLHSQELLDVIHRYDPAVGNFYATQIAQQKNAYFESFTPLREILSDERSKHRLPGEKLSDKEKQAIKDKFTDFNKGIEEICRLQKSYAIPDDELRRAIKSENKRQVVVWYSAFLDGAGKTPFTKNADKYIRYTAHDISNMLDNLFDVTS
ncbi:exocyst complex component 7-like [Watersipora subatra]|uniref:exocyst complex component 7-like n=1 Tax=Watersipora subatra TaxID=2589382 RepID=UPI00355BE0D8